MLRSLFSQLHQVLLVRYVILQTFELKTHYSQKSQQLFLRLCAYCTHLFNGLLEMEIVILDM